MDLALVDQTRRGYTSLRGAFGDRPPVARQRKLHWIAGFATICAVTHPAAALPGGTAAPMLLIGGVILWFAWYIKAFQDYTGFTYHGRSAFLVALAALLVIHLASAPLLIPGAPFDAALLLRIAPTYVVVSFFMSLMLPGRSARGRAGRELATLSVAVSAVAALLALVSADLLADAVELAAYGAPDDAVAADYCRSSARNWLLPAHRACAARLARLHPDHESHGDLLLSTAFVLALVATLLLVRLIARARRVSRGSAVGFHSGDGFVLALFVIATVTLSALALTALVVARLPLAEARIAAPPVLAVAVLALALSLERLGLRRLVNDLAYAPS